MKKILLIVHAPQSRPGHLNWIALRDRVREDMSDVQVDMSALSELTFVVSGDKARIFDANQGYDVADFDLVVFRTIYGQVDAAIAVAAYCRKHAVPYVDEYIPQIGNTKLSCAFIRWEHDLPVPPTAYGPAASLAALAEDGELGWPLVVKADNGKKGDDNFLIEDVDELNRCLVERPDVHFVMQTFIPNKGDYRIVVMNYVSRMAILRTAAPGSHLNNTSKGGGSGLVSLDTLDPRIVQLAVDAAKLEKLAVAGVDIIVDAQTGKPYILEVNRAPQIATGAYVDEKMKHYTTALRELLETPTEDMK